MSGNKLMDVKRKIVFFYIESSSNGFIRKKGFNFTSRYNFVMEDWNDMSVLVDTDVDDDEIIPDGFFDPISDITAIVGQNGSGKTTLLSELCRLTASKVVFDDKDVRYAEYNKYTYDKQKRLVILEENGELVCYHNLDKFEMKLSNNKCREVNYFVDHDAHKNDLLKQKGPYGFSTIVFTNSYYWKNVETNVNDIGNGTIEHGNMLSKAYLTLETMTMYAREFYRHKIRKSDSIQGRYYQFLNVCINKRSATAKDFQQILDVFFLKKCNDIDFTKWFKPSLHVSILLVSDFINDILDNTEFPSVKEEDSFESRIRETYQVYMKYVKEISIADIKTDQILRLFLNLLFDMMLFDRVVDDEKLISEYGYKTFQNKDDIRKFVYDKIQNSKTHYRKFRTYVEEIEAFEDIIKNSHTNRTILPIEDLAYKEELIFENKTMEYDAFVDFIYRQVMEEKESFIIRCVYISGLTYSSGERTLLNFLTWQNMISHQELFIRGKDKKLQDNILLFIDEVDLYLHPEWQQRFIFEMNKLIERFFSHKNVQLVYSTHSPISLSDMPRGNVIFLKGIQGECVVDKKCEHMRTFGNNIYQLYNDAFYLKDVGQIGEFAKSKIRELIRELSPAEQELDLVYEVFTEDKIRSYESRISIIGEPVIKNQLLNMLYRHIGNHNVDESLVDRQIRVTEEKLKRYRRLKNNNDTNKF